MRCVLNDDDPVATLGESGGFSRYDLFLGTMPLPLIAGVGAGIVTPGPFVDELTVDALVAALLVGYALFVDSPT